MAEPEAQHDLLARYNYGALADRAQYVPISTRYPAMGRDYATYRAYFAETPDRDTFSEPIDDLLPDMATADNATNSKGEKLFSDLEIWTTPKHKAMLLVGIVEMEGRKEHFLVAQSTSHDHKILVAEMEDELAAEAEAKARIERTDKIVFSIMDVSGSILGALAAAALIGFVFVQGWNWWLIPIAALVVGGFFLADIAKDAIGTGICAACVVTMAFYGLIVGVGALAATTTTHGTILVCETTPFTVTDAGGETYSVASGTYYVTVGNVKDGKTITVHEPTGRKAASTFVRGHAYEVTVDHQAGSKTIKSAREVVNTMGQCG